MNRIYSSVIFALSLCGCAGKNKTPTIDSPAGGAPSMEQVGGAASSAENAGAPGISASAGASSQSASGTGGALGGIAGAGAGGEMAGVASCAALDFSAVSARLQKAVTDQEVAGAGLIIVSAACETPLYVQSFGNQSNASVVELASASKLPSAVILLRLVEAGQLALTDPVSRFIPDWPNDKRDITIRQLLSHTSGLPGNSRCLADDKTTLEACANAIGQETLIAAPGTEFNYGGSSFQVAGRVAELASHRSWNELFQQELRTPCGLEHLSFDASADNSLGSATNPRIAGGAASDLKDYGMFLRMLLNGGYCGDRRLLSASSIDELSADELGSVTINSSPLPKTWSYGLGLWREPPTSGNTVTLFSDPGAFGAYPWLDRARGYAAFLLVKKSLRVSLALVPDLRSAIDAVPSP